MKATTSAGILLLGLLFLSIGNVFAQDWDAMGNPTPTPTAPRPSGDMSGDWDSMGYPR